jgi:hypothetical protein
VIESFTVWAVMGRLLIRVFGAAAKAKFGDKKWHSKKLHPWLIEEKPM